MVTKIGKTQKRIKILETASIICAIGPIGAMNMNFTLAGIGIGLMLQVWIYLSYKSIGEERNYLRNKMGAMLGAVLIAGYLLVKHDVLTW